ncbi:MAG: hypothetical protein HKN81_05055 [Gammaproteobacteria bacterium]|nr:hypothetical protein [Gammaproteobacteria bacterium]NND36487.1 hypothetical protein [Gammaproteobacteria bacterium]
MTPRRICAIATVLAASAASADELVERADANDDGFVSLYELRAAHYADLEFNRRIEQSFADYDTDGDGLISAAERRAKRAEASQAAAIAPVVVPALDNAAGASGAATDSPSPAASSTTAGAAASLPDSQGLSRSESWILEIDADNSGGASIEELVASGDGSQWFSDKAFSSADENGDGDLDPDELEVLMQSLERRRR